MPLVLLSLIFSNKGRPDVTTQKGRVGNTENSIAVGLNQSLAQGLGDGFSLGVDLELGVDVLEMKGHSIC